MGMENLERKVREDRAKIWDGMAALIEKADLESRSLTVDEAADYDTRSAELMSKDGELKRITDYNARATAEQDIADTRGKSVDEVKDRSQKEMRAWGQFLRRGVNGIEPALKPYFQTRTTEYSAGMQEAGFQSSGTTGGYMVPQGFWDNLQIALKQYGGILPLARLVTTSTGNPMDWPTVDPTSIVGGIIGEAQTDTFNAFTFGQGVLQAWTYTSGVILASLELINDSAFDVDSFVSDRIGEAIGRAVAAHLISGSGSGQPLGIVTALAASSGLSSGGIYTSPATSTTLKLNTIASYAATPTLARLAGALVGFDDLLAMIQGIDPAYRNSGNCQFVFNDKTLQMLRTVADGYGHPLWNPNVQVGGTDTVYGYGYTVDQNMSNVSTTASTVSGVLFGDFQRAMVVRQVTQADVMRLTERYADARQVGYYGFIRLDARSNDLRAAIAYKSPAS